MPNKSPLPGFALNVYGTRQFLSADRRYGIFSHQITEHRHFDDPVARLREPYPHHSSKQLIQLE
jgi:hypothetical protein